MEGYGVACSGFFGGGGLAILDDAGVAHKVQDQCGQHHQDPNDRLHMAPSRGMGIGMIKEGQGEVDADGTGEKEHGQAKGKESRIGVHGFWLRRGS